MEKRNNRRDFLGCTGAAFMGTATLAAVPAAFAESMKGPKRHSFVMSADTADRCGTCVFWGGKRHVNREKTEVHVDSLGMCNNPKSPNYHSVTSPDTGPMKVWVKWPAIDG